MFQSPWKQDIPYVPKDEITIASYNLSLIHIYGYEDGERDSNEQPLVKKEIIIEDESHIGANAVIVAGVHIGKRCQIGAGSVVTKNIPDYSVAVGNPAKIIKQYNFQKRVWENTNNKTMNQ